MAAVPIVDFSVYTLDQTSDQTNDQTNDHDTRRAVAQQIDEAFRTVGFVYLKNHGVPKEQLKECFDWSQKFFSLPLETKLLAPHPPGGSHHRGYSAPGLEKVTQHTYTTASLAAARSIPDCKESFEAGNALDVSQPNIWPPDHVLPGFRTFIETAFFPSCTALVHNLLNALSTALEVPDPGLSPTHSLSHFQLRLLHYPPLPAARLANNTAARISAHSDFGSLTLLFQDAVGGLEIADPQRPERFRAVEPVEGAVLVNVGDLLSRWSNGRWVSTVHRVGAPAVDGERRGGGGETMLPDRYSIPFFAAPDPDTLIEALPGCWGEGRPKLYESVTAREYVQMRMAALYEGGKEEEEEK
ncbi:hypothetical protein E8E13_009558 [Curvularia kusanoi]|uniref:Fe2OG dioxygenase domain-containing protein n=1 Tax=Curvularia kusanoi TaxID=90978 RepID=A0A9P4W8B7_CURKU|nr:hypothetical protein E8E13_009558 [Curvularia kusanoi]